MLNVKDQCSIPINAFSIPTATNPLSPLLPPQRKQQELGDHMDLSSYLLKPIQRISKYSLLLQDMLGVCGPQRDRDREELQAAADVIRFQMRHGNDLLTMDAIQDCDVSLPTKS